MFVDIGQASLFLYPSIFLIYILHLSHQLVKWVPLFVGDEGGVLRFRRSDGGENCSTIVHAGLGCLL